MRLGIGLGLFKAGLISAGVRIFSAFQTRVIGDGGTVEAGTCVVNGINGSALLQQASLLLIPSGYKGGKLYAEIPTNGNGDLTWTRTSTAIRTNSSGLLESMGSGVPRLSYMYGSCPALLLEPQRTNSLRNSTMVGASTSPSTLPTNWTSFTTYGLTVAIAGVGTENGVNYIDISYTGTATTSDAVRIGFEQPLQISASNGQSWSLSTYAKIISQSAPPSSYDLRMTERALVGGGVVTLGTQSITPTSTLTRFTYTRTLSGGATVGYVAPEFSVPVINGTSYNFTIRIAQPQMELGAYATTAILTTGSATATRVADSFSRSNIYTNGLISASGGTWFVELRNNIGYTRDNVGNHLILSDTSLTNFFRLRNDGTPNTRLRIQKNVSGVGGDLFLTTTNTVKIAIKWNGTTADVFVNGVKEVSATSFTATQLQDLASNPQLPAFIQSMALYPTPLSDTDCTTLTTL